MSIVSFLVCRTAYCRHCAERGSPHFGQYYALFGTAGQQYKFGFVTKVISKALMGFTPHLFVKVRQVDGIIFYERTCLMHGCGIEIYNVKSKIVLWDETHETIYEHSLIARPTRDKRLAFNILLSRKGSMDAKHWNALVVHFKDESFWLK